MKHALLLVISLIFCLLRTEGRTVAPADTLVGHAHLVGLLSTGLCTRMAAESQAFDQLPKHELNRLLQDWTTSIIMENEDVFEEAFQPLGKYKRDPYKWRLAREALFRTAAKCAEARTFLVQVGWRTRHEKSMPSPEERAALLPAAQLMCQTLDEENARAPFAQRPAADLKLALQQAMGKAMVAKASELMAYYGGELFKNAEWTNLVGERVFLVVFDTCPSYFVQLFLGDKKRG